MGEPGEQDAEQNGKERRRYPSVDPSGHQDHQDAPGSQEEGGQMNLVDLPDGREEDLMDMASFG